MSPTGQLINQTIVHPQSFITSLKYLSRVSMLKLCQLFHYLMCTICTVTVGFRDLCQPINVKEWFEGL